MSRFVLYALVLLVGLAGCATKRPVLYPNDPLYAVGEAQAQQDVSGCMERADADVGRGRQGEPVVRAATGGATGAAAGAAGGAIIGRAGIGAAVGGAAAAASGFVRGLLRSREPDAAYRAYVNRCLREFGYEPIGWR